MKARELLATAQVPGGDELRLFRHDRDYMIVLDRNELINGRMNGSEEELAPLTVARLRNRTNPRVLIGGYGMGFTLRAAKAALVRGGILAIWSAGDDPAFTHLLGANGFAANPTRVRARANGKGAQHTIWLAESV